ncbi:hypothetical protein BDZ85DRAFT_252642 [Elsinoe ampelina]|uniref:Rhodopsin domain-containing protein n=1 Tax=Elsinoe ampelina TaxID=302913 RepID=A0A6A6G187_9PEZI|nr:hypothetical protein BDZ85DRAFT_252642 [Elsinoe ampelina]
MAKSLIGGLGPTILGIVWTEVALSTILVLLRAYAASKKNGKWRADFIWIVIALITALLASAVVSIGVTKGLGNHTRLMSFTQLFEAVKYIWMSIWFGPQAKKRATTLWIIGFLIASTSLIQIFLSMFQCTTVSRIWVLTDPGTCPLKVVSSRFSYFQGAVQAAGDFILALWPISIVWNLQASRKVKTAFCLLMAIGILPAIAVICRIVSLPSIFSSADPTYDFGGFMLWAVTEVWMVIILGSIPPLRPLFLRVFYGVHPHSSGNRASAPTHEMVNGEQHESEKWTQESSNQDNH